MVEIQIATPPGVLCAEVEQRITKLIEEHELDCSVELVTDFEAIIDLQVFSIPGLLIDGVLKSVGRIPEIPELVGWLGLDVMENPERPTG
jgi:hypothetical protein